jgi:hypothetical protein
VAWAVSDLDTSILTTIDGGVHQEWALCTLGRAWVMVLHLTCRR